MSKPFIVLLMIFCHIIDDYRLQGNLADFKQKKWWTKLFDKENIDEEKRKKYSHDYIAALIMHSLSWSFMIMLPIAYFFSFKPPVAFFVVYAANTLIHAVVDDLKANRFKINLITDQAIHLIQVGITAYILLWS